MIEVTAGIINKNKKVLIARRAPHKHLGGYWEFPGGKIEKNETPENCLTRELFEELGIKVHVDAFFMQNEHDYGEKQILLKAFFCTYLEGEIQLNDHDCIEWIDIRDFEKYNFAPADIPFIKTLIKTL